MSGCVGINKVRSEKSMLSLPVSIRPKIVNVEGVGGRSGDSLTACMDVDLVYEKILILLLYYKIKLLYLFIRKYFGNNL